MMEFIESTWAIWWLVAIAVIVRWFFLIEARSESAEYFSVETEHSEPVAVLMSARFEKTEV